jgi:cyanophycinase
MVSARPTSPCRSVRTDSSPPRDRLSCLQRGLPAAVLLLLWPTQPGFAQPAAPPLPEAPGTLVVCGGGPLPDAVRDHFIELAGGPRARLVIIPTASKKADTAEVARALLPWKDCKVASVVLLHTRSRARANDPAFLKPLTEATGVWIAGGDQRLLTAAYLDTAVLAEIKKVLARGGVVGGTSAGAAVMSNVMIAGGVQRPEIDKGFGLLGHVIVDQHFHQRKRLQRLQAALVAHPELVGLGVDEETAVVIRNGIFKVVGRFSVVTCIAASPDQPASVQVLGAGKQADLSALWRAALARLRPVSPRVGPGAPAVGSSRPVAAGNGAGETIAAPR